MLLGSSRKGSGKGGGGTTMVRVFKVRSKQGLERSM